MKTKYLFETERNDTYTSPMAYSNSSGSIVPGRSNVCASVVSDSTVKARGAFGCCLFDSEA